jgi:hypothetical protein
MQKQILPLRGRMTTKRQKQRQGRGVGLGVALGVGLAEVEVEKRISPLRRSQMRERLRSK